MPTEPGRYIPVSTPVVLQTLIEALNDQVEERRATRALLETPPALDADHNLVGDNDPALERNLRVCGYLARMVEDDPEFPVAPAWPDQDGAGAHTNLSGVGLVRGSEHRTDAGALMEHLTARRAQEQIVENGELPVNAGVAPARHA